MHPMTLEALIGACLKSESFVVDFVASIGMYVISILLLHWIFIP
jgi:hypothetical protein